MDGAEVINRQYDLASNFSDTYACVNIGAKYGLGGYPDYSGGKYGYIKVNGDTFLPLKFDSATKFRNGMACVKLDGRHGIINKSGQEIYFDHYSWRYHDSGEEGFSDGRCLVSLLDKYGYIDENGEKIIAFTFKDARRFSEGFAAVKINDLWGYIDTNGKILIPPKYKYPDNFKDGLAHVNNGGSYIYIDKRGVEYYEEEGF